MIEVLQGKAGSFEEDAALKFILKYYDCSSAAKLKQSQVSISGLQNIGMARNGVVASSNSEANPDGDKKLNLIMSPFSFGGAFAPLPLEFYNELIFLSKEGYAEPLSFLNIFVDRLTKTDFDLRRNFNPSLETRRKSEVLSANFLNTTNQLEVPKNTSHKKSILSLLPYISRRPVSASIISKSLSKFFECRIIIHQHQEKWIKLPTDCVSLLSSSQSSGVKLGQSSFLGSTVASRQSKLLFSVFDFDFSLFSLFLESKSFKDELKKFLMQVLSSPTTCVFKFNFESALNINKENFSLTSNWSRLGENTWLSSKQDVSAPNVILEC